MKAKYKWAQRDAICLSEILSPRDSYKKGWLDGFEEARKLISKYVRLNQDEKPKILLDQIFLIGENDET